MICNDSIKIARLHSMQPSIGMNSDYNYIFYDFEVKNPN